MGSPSVLVFTLLIISISRINSFQSYSDPEHNGNGYETHQWRLDQLKRLENNVCSRFEEYRDKYIIDIRASVNNGAKLLYAKKADDALSCAMLCCDNAVCDLSLFRMNGESDSGHNCYMVKCGNPASCRMAYHKDFVSMMFKLTAAEIGE